MGLVKVSLGIPMTDLLILLGIVVVVTSVLGRRVVSGTVLGMTAAVKRVGKSANVVVGVATVVM